MPSYRGLAILVLLFLLLPWRRLRWPLPMPWDIFRQVSRGTGNQMGNPTSSNVKPLDTIRLDTRRCASPNLGFADAEKPTDQEFENEDHHFLLSSWVMCRCVLVAGSTRHIRRTLIVYSVCPEFLLWWWYSSSATSVLNWGLSPVCEWCLLKCILWTVRSLVGCKERFGLPGRIFRFMGILLEDASQLSWFHTFVSPMY